MLPLLATAATPPTEPALELGDVGLSGYREHSFRAPTPPSSPVAWTVDTAEARALIDSGTVIPIDVQATVYRPAAAELPAAWLPSQPRLDIPGSYWLPNMGYPDISPELDDYYRTHLARLTGGQFDQALLLYCIADCWLAWNALKRVAAYGYTRLYWYPVGSDGWREAGWALAEAEPLPFAGSSAPPPAAVEPDNWLSHHGNHAAWRYSALTGIDRHNVSRLRVAWTFALGGLERGGNWSQAGLEGTPLVEDGFMYLSDGWGTVYKLELRPSSGRLVWKTRVGVDRDWAGTVACCGVNHRGVGLWRNRVISHTLDGRLLALDKQTGDIVWERQVADPAVGETLTAAPLIVRDLAITGVAGAEFGIRGWLAATDLTTGQERWRTYTIPAPGEPGHETWADSHGAWKTGGGSTWVTGAYDPVQDLLFWGVGNPAPDWDAAYRPGDNLYTNSVLALDAATGRINWHYQFTPNDPYDYDGVGEQVLVDTAERQLVLHADRNGFAYALDRRDGRFVWGVPFVEQLTWTRGLDPVTGRPLDYNPQALVQTYAPGTAPTREQPISTVCPGNMGGKNWPPTAYHPVRQLWYIPVIESCVQLVNQVIQPGSYQPREPFTGGGPRPYQRNTGSIAVLDVSSGQPVAKHKTAYPMLGGLLVTAGDLVFAGHPDGAVVALDAETLAELWRFETGVGITAPPISYGLAGKHYIALLVGADNVWPTGVEGLHDLAPAAMLYVFSL